MKTLEQIQSDYSCCLKADRKTELRAIVIYMESQPSEEFCKKQLDFNEKRLKAIESEIQSLIFYDRTLTEKEIKKQKKFKDELKKILKQNEILKYILE